MNRNLVSAFLLSAIFTVAACKTSNGPDASSTPTPKEISSSDQVVKVFSHFIPSASPPSNVELVISPGYHINANPATFPYLIATEIQPGKVDGIKVGDKLAYPAPKIEKFAFAEKPLGVYEGKITIPIPLTPDVGAKGQRTIPFKIRVQACDTDKCYPPATLDASLTVDIDSLRR
jgi:hypothetical protein